MIWGDWPFALGLFYHQSYYWWPFCVIYYQTLNDLCAFSINITGRGCGSPIASPGCHIQQLLHRHIGGAITFLSGRTRATEASRIDDLQQRWSQSSSFPHKLWTLWRLGLVILQHFGVIYCNTFGPRRAFQFFANFNQVASWNRMMVNHDSQGD